MTRKTAFYEGWSWFKFNNLGLALGTSLKFYTSVARTKTKSQKVLGANSYACRRYRGKTGRGDLPSPILNRVKLNTEVLIDKKSLLVTELNKFEVTGIIHFQKGILQSHVAKFSFQKLPYLLSIVFLYKRKR